MVSLTGDEQPDESPHMQHHIEDTTDNPSHDMSDDSASTSAYSSISGDSLPSIHEYGHRYHGSGRLMVPIDEAEDRRLNIQHELYTTLLDGNLTASKLPIHPTNTTTPAATNTPRTFSILDAGAGNGIWSIAMALAHPSASVLGVDITPALLPAAIPANLTFEIADLAELWAPPGRSFDFIHLRNLAAGGGVRDWPALLREALAALRPGGQLEYAEMRPRFVDPSVVGGDGCLAIGEASRELELEFEASCRELGLDPDPTSKVARWLVDQGGVGVKEQVHYVPMCASGEDEGARKKGELLSLLMEDALELLTLRIFCKAGRDEQEVRQMIARVKQEIKDPSLGSLVQINFITARKASNAGDSSK